MIVVRQCEDRNALAAFLFSVCLNDLLQALPFHTITPEMIVAAIRSWDIVEFFDTKTEVIVGAAAREPNYYLHIYIDSSRRRSWAPHTSLQAALDIFLSDTDNLYAAIPLTNEIAISIARKLGFIHTKTQDELAFHVLTPQTRKRFGKKCHRRFRECDVP